MRLEKNKSIKPFRCDYVGRPWGEYGLYALNEHSTSKILYVVKGGWLSMQYHFQRSQLYVILDDMFEIQYSTEPVPKEIIDIENNDKKAIETELFMNKHLVTEIAYEGDIFGFEKLCIHRTRYLGPRAYGKILDVAYGHNDEEDIVRIKDEYGR